MKYRSFTALVVRHSATIAAADPIKVLVGQDALRALHHRH
jgi:hypothetical protein